MAEGQVEGGCGLGFLLGAALLAGLGFTTSVLSMATVLAIVLIAVPLIIQTYLVFFLGFGASRLWKVPYEIAAPSGMIGASNFFELAVAVAISLFGLSSGATLATVVGVLVEVPVMLSLVRIARRSRERFPAMAEAA